MIAYKGFHTSLRFSWLISLAMGTTKNERTSLDYPRVTSFDALKQLTDILHIELLFLVENLSY